MLRVFLFFQGLFLLFTFWVSETDSIDTITENYKQYTTIHKAVPSNTSPDNIEFVKWQRDNHKLERDIYLPLATLLSSGLIYVITHYTDKYNKYMDFRDRVEAPEKQLKQE